MKTFSVVSIVVLALLLGGTSGLFAAAETKSADGNVRVLKVKGTVVVELRGKNQQSLKEGAFIQQDHVIKTGRDSQAWLLFSNGTTVTIQPNTTFSVDKFLQTPFDSSKVDYAEIKSEPSVSQTKISINEGTIIADVAKLNKGSTFQIGTPVGVAGIRGTLIQVTVNTTAGGQVSVTIDMPHGLADFVPLHGSQVVLADGQTVTVSVNSATNTLTLGNVSPLSAQTSQAIQSLAEQVAAAAPVQNAFEGVPPKAPEVLGTPTTDTSGGFGGNTGPSNVGTAPGGGGGGGGGRSTPTPTPNPPPS